MSTKHYPAFVHTPDEQARWDALDDNRRERMLDAEQELAEGVDRPLTLADFESALAVGFI